MTAVWIIRKQNAFRLLLLQRPDHDMSPFTTSVRHPQARGRLDGIRL